MKMKLKAFNSMILYMYTKYNKHQQPKLSVVYPVDTCNCIIHQCIRFEEYFPCLRNLKDIIPAGYVKLDVTCK